MPARSRLARPARVRTGNGKVAGFCAICATVTAQHGFTSGRRRRWQWLGSPVGDVRHYTVCDTCGYQTDVTAARTTAPQQRRPPGS
ncbi:MAG: hypothetical protein QOJ11_2120 [Frankiales bacterium]|jgi:hypothetical protein|nr:hypothetical protein [Frankiales bacterium]